MNTAAALDLTGYRMLTIPAHNVQPGDLLGDLHGTWNTATRNDDSTEGETSTRDIVLVPLDGTDPHTLSILAMERVAVLRPAPANEPASAQDAAQRSVDALTRAIALLDQAGAHLPQIAFLTRNAHDSADTALMVATNELKLAQRDAS